MLQIHANHCELEFHDMIRPDFIPACNIVGYVFLFVAAGAVYLIVRAWIELRKMHGHHPEGSVSVVHFPRFLLNNIVDSQIFV